MHMSALASAACGALLIICLAQPSLAATSAADSLAAVKSGRAQMNGVNLGSWLVTTTTRTVVCVAYLMSPRPLCRPASAVDRLRTQRVPGGLLCVRRWWSSGCLRRCAAMGVAARVGAA